MRQFISHFRFVLGYWWLFLVVLATGTAASLLEGLGLSFVFPIMEDIDTDLAPEIPFPYNQISSHFDGLDLTARLRIVAGLLVITTLVKSGMKFMSNMANAHFQVICIKHFRMLCLNQLVTVGMRYFNDKKVGELHTICAGHVGAIGSLVGLVGNAVSALLNIAVYLAMILVLSWKMTLLAMALASLASLLLRFIMQRADEAGKDFTKT